MNEETLIILKPDCMEAGKCGAVISRFEAEGFTIVASNVQLLSSELLKEHYAHVAHLPFFPEIESFMSSRPVLVLLLSGESVIARVRALLGPTNSEEAPKGTIRGDMGTDRMRNMVHASDSPESAAIEKARFFPGL
jgi:nucleoside-diphosphate kinase